MRQANEKDDEVVRNEGGIIGSRSVLQEKGCIVAYVETPGTRECIDFSHFFSWYE